MSTGEPPFRDRQVDESLIRDIMGGLRPSMPDSARQMNIRNLPSGVVMLSLISVLMQGQLNLIRASFFER